MTIMTSSFISVILLVYHRPQTHCCSHLLLNTTLSRALLVNPSAKIHGIVGLPCSLEQNKLSSAPMQNDPTQAFLFRTLGLTVVKEENHVKQLQKRLARYFLE